MAWVFPHIERHRRSDVIQWLRLRPRAKLAVWANNPMPLGQGYLQSRPGRTGNGLKGTGRVGMKKRKQYIVYRKIQIALTIKFLRITILFSLFIGFEVYVIMWPVVSGFLPEHVMSLVRSRVLFRTLLLLVPITLFLVAFSVILSNRFAGPLYRINRTLGELLGGEDVQQIRLRKKDMLKGLAEQVNRFMAMVKETSASGQDKK